MSIRIALALLLTLAPAYAKTVTTPAGPITGGDQPGVSRFLGIPYAAPPVGDLRWRAPQPAPHFETPFTANQFGAACMQPMPAQSFGPYTAEFLTSGKVSEDCLTLNIWAPENASNLPVLFWIHGGGYNSGASSIPIYDGAALAKQGAVVVSINYRLGVFGYLASPQLGEASGNFGLLDAMQALRWVRANIAAFGGNPDNITIDGQSAGGDMVDLLLATPSAQGLFAKAIVQSAPIGGIKILDAVKADATGASLLAALHVNGVDAARRLDAATIMAAAAHLPSGGGLSILFTPVHGTKLLPEDADQALIDGKLADVPILAGVTSGDPTMMAPRDRAGFRARLSSRYGSAAPAFTAAFLPQTEAAAPAATAEEGHDRLKTGLIWWSNLHAQHSHAPLYFYYFTKTLPGPGQDMYGAFHTAEVVYEFGNLTANPARQMQPVDRQVSDDIQHRWLAFARGASPNYGSASPWLPSDDTTRIESLGEDDHPEPLPPLPIQRLFLNYFANGGRPDLF